MDRSKYFYCYSYKMKDFIKSMGLHYESTGINKKANTKYFLFEKSVRLDEIIAIWNSIKHK